VLRVLRSCGEKDITLDYESRDWGFKSLRERAGSASSNGGASGPHPGDGDPIPSLSTVAIAQSAERWAVIAEAASSILASHPKRRWRSGDRT
jgi:hypothetical protein